MKSRELRTGHRHRHNMPQIDELKMQPSMPGPSVKLAAVLA